MAEPCCAWTARPSSGFTLLFEGMAMALAMHMPVAVAAGFLGIEDKRLWRVVFHYVDAAVARMDLSGVRSVAIDETAARRGHDYITLVVDMQSRRVAFVADGRSADTVRQFADRAAAMPRASSKPQSCWKRVSDTT
jgi:transposase